MNDLQFEKSPYLLQHKNNPVDWLPWGPLAFEKAQRENKPIFLSIGYSTCHWCHVMARESFENPEIAASLNQNFVAIKVDREERPDVDALYMSALLSLTGSGGWPLSAWLTPDGRPFFAGTYFPPVHFLPMIDRIAELWKTDNTRMLQDAQTFHQALTTSLQGRSDAKPIEPAALTLFAEQFEERFDENFGGLSGAPKFPQSMALMALMRIDRLQGATQAREIVRATLDGMTSAGLYDHLDGGFHRYSVDDEWSVPHFEKMLYDQAWIATSLFEASQFLDEPHYRRIGLETLKFVDAQLSHPDGGFYSAIDAESINPDTGQKEEGAYFTFSEKELRDAGAEEFLKVCPTVLGRTVLHRPPDSISVDIARLRRLRATHPKPHCDDKVITAWNGWMIGAFCSGFLITGEAHFLRRAESAWRFLKTYLWTTSGLKRRWREDHVDIPGTSEDYAAMVYAGLELHRASGDVSYLNEAAKLQHEMIAKFWSYEEQGFFLSDGADPHLLFRFQQDSDGVTPATNSLAAQNLLWLGMLTNEAQFSEMAQQVLSRQIQRFEGSPLYAAYFGVALAENFGGRKVIVENPGAEGERLRQSLRSSYRPFLRLVAEKSAAPGERFLVCTTKECLPPVSTAAEVLKA